MVLVSGVGRFVRGERIALRIPVRRGRHEEIDGRNVLDRDLQRVAAKDHRRRPDDGAGVREAVGIKLDPHSPPPHPLRGVDHGAEAGEGIEHDLSRLAVLRDEPLAQRRRDGVVRLLEWFELGAPLVIE